MNILILTQWFNPEPNNMKALIFAKGLRDKGHTVEVLTGIPNYPTGKVFDGYHLKFYQKEIMDNILIHRVLLYPSHDENSIRRSLNYISFSFFATIISPFVIKKKIDVIYVYHPPSSVMLPAILLSKMKKSKIMLDVNDLWPDTFMAIGMMNRKWFLMMMNKWMNYCYKKADKINVLSAGIKKILEDRKVDAKKIETIPVWCNESLINKDMGLEFQKKYHLQDCFVAIYAGAMSRAQNLSTFLHVANQLQDKIPNFRLILIGHGVCLEELKAFVKEKEIKNVIFIPVIPPEELSKILNLSDILLIHLKKDPLYEVTIPSKIPYYLSLGKPIVAGLNGDAAYILKESKSGFVCMPEDMNEIAEAIGKIYQLSQLERERLGEHARQYYKDNLSLKTGIARFEKVMSEMSKESVRSMEKREYQVCKNCVMDTTDEKIIFDENGVCDYCNGFYHDILPNWHPDERGAKELERISNKIRKDGIGKKYDCILGLSGGVDSSYLAYVAKEKMKLRPLIFVVDTGWNLKVADDNIERIVKGLDLDMKKQVVDWEEMKDLQLAFFQSQVPYQDMPQDHAIFASLYNYAAKHGIKYVLTGANNSTECIIPPYEWTYINDVTFIKNVHKKFGKKKLKTFPLCGMFKYRIYYPYFKGMKVVKPLNLVPFHQETVIRELNEKFGWQRYENKHYEDLFTRFYEGYYLPTKFGYDKRKGYFSSMILSGQMTRDEALEELKKQGYETELAMKDMELISHKLGITKEELEELIKGENKTFRDYKNSFWKIKLAIKVARLFGVEKRNFR